MNNIIDLSLKNSLLSEALRIGDDLLKRADYDKQGIFWNILDYDNIKASWYISNDIYLGTPGICLFLIELYKLTYNDKYLNAARKGLKWSVKHDIANPTTNYAFYSGRLGISYALLKLYEIDPLQIYLDQAIHISKSCEQFLDRAYIPNDLISGTSGIILALLHIHSVTRESWLLDKMNYFLNYLVDKIEVGPVGIYWDRSKDNLHGLCGFAHGNAGIGFVFLELGNYFQNEAYHYLAEQAFLYESYWFKKEMNNWPDFRIVATPEKIQMEFEQSIQSTNYDYFSEGRDMNAWCHGAAGIGLSRIRAFELFNNVLYKREAAIAVQKTINEYYCHTKLNYESLILCHGLSGNLDLLIETYKAFDNENDIDFVHKQLFNFLMQNDECGIFSYENEHFKIHKHNQSLFLGNAGIGYQFLRAIEPFKIPSILYPKLKGQRILSDNDSSLSPSYWVLNDIRKNILQRIYPRTLSALDLWNPEKISDYFKIGPGHFRLHEIDEFNEYIKNTVLTSAIDHKCQIFEVFNFETLKIKTDHNSKSDKWISVELEYYKKNITEIMLVETETFENRYISINPNVTLYQSKWDLAYSSKEDIFASLQKEEKDYYYLFMPTGTRVLEIQISSISYSILEAFKSKIGISNGVKDLLNNCDLDQKEKEFYAPYLLQQIKEMLKHGILFTYCHS